MAIGMSAFGWWRPDLPLEQGYRYWRDVHGPMAARTSGLELYRQLHLGPARDDLWPATSGIELACPREEQPHSCADILFAPPAAEPDPLIAYIGADERNFVRRNVIYGVAEGGTRTVRGRESVAQGPVDSPAFLVCVKRAGDGLRAYLTDVLAPAWAEADGVQRLHLTLLEPYAPQGPPSPGVERDWPEERQYHAWLEVDVRDEAVAAGLLGTVPDLSSHVRAVHAYPIRERYTLVQDARPTEVGLRGWPAVETILAAGAENQRRIELLEALYGPVVHGAS